MNKHTVNWPCLQITDVLVQFIGGAWFVSYKDTSGDRQFLLKANNRRKGFRSMEQVVFFLKYQQGIKVFNAEAQ
jgi:hypothetical protein